MNDTIKIDEDEIDLRELFSTIWNNKFKIIFFTTIVTSLTILYTLSIPNSYKSSVSLVPQTQAKPSLGGLGALAGIAGINLNSGGDMDITTSFNIILKDPMFEKMIIKKYNLIEKLTLKKENLVFAFGYDKVYNYIHGKIKKKETLNDDEKIYNVYKSLLGMITVASDKKSGIITISAQLEDRFLAKKLVDIYLKELTAYLRKIEMRDVNKQIKYYTNELYKTDEISMKEQLGQLASSLVQKKVLSMANEFYNVKKLTQAQVAYIKDKSKPKRSLIIIVSFVTSIILAIFMVFFLQFLKKDES